MAVRRRAAAEEAQSLLAGRDLVPCAGRDQDRVAVRPGGGRRPAPSRPSPRRGSRSPRSPRGSGVPSPARPEGRLGEALVPDRRGGEAEQLADRAPVRGRERFGLASERTITRRGYFTRARSGLLRLRPRREPDPGAGLRRRAGVAVAVHRVRRTARTASLNGWYEGFGVKSAQSRPDCQPSRRGSSAISKLKNAPPRAGSTPCAVRRSAASPGRRRGRRSSRRSCAAVVRGSVCPSVSTPL